MDTPQLLSAVFRETGVALDPSDPIMTTASINRVLMDEAKSDIRRMLDDAGAIASQAKEAPAVLTDKQFSDLGYKMRCDLVEVAKLNRPPVTWHPIVYAALAGMAILAAGIGGGVGLEMWRSRGDRQGSKACNPWPQPRWPYRMPLGRNARSMCRSIKPVTAPAQSR